MKFESQIVRFNLKSVLLASLSGAAIASTFLLAQGYGSSQRASEPISVAVSQATSNLYSQCSGSVSNVRVMQSVQSYSGWFYIDAQAKGKQTPPCTSCRGLIRVTRRFNSADGSVPVALRTLI